MRPLTDLSIYVSAKSKKHTYFFHKIPLWCYLEAICQMKKIHPLSLTQRAIQTLKHILNWSADNSTVQMQTLGKNPSMFFSSHVYFEYLLIQSNVPLPARKCLDLTPRIQHLRITKKIIKYSPIISNFTSTSLVGKKTCRSNKCSLDKNNMSPNHEPRLSLIQPSRLFLSHSMKFFPGAVTNVQLRTLICRRLEQQTPKGSGMLPFLWCCVFSVTPPDRETFYGKLQTEVCTVHLFSHWVSRILQNSLCTAFSYSLNKSFLQVIYVLIPEHLSKAKKTSIIRICNHNAPSHTEVV